MNCIKIYFLTGVSSYEQLSLSILSRFTVLLQINQFTEFLLCYQIINWWTVTYLYQSEIWTWELFKFSWHCRPHVSEKKKMVNWLLSHFLQATVNRSKGNRTELSRSDLIQKSSYCRVSGTSSLKIYSMESLKKI